MEEKRSAQRLDEIPSTKLPEVLQLASELHARDQAAMERAQERRELMKAAAEAGLPPEYLERAAAQLHAPKASPPPQRCRRRSDRRFLLWIGVALFFALRGAHHGAAPFAAPTPAVLPAAVAPLGPCRLVDLRSFANQQLTDSMLATDHNDLSQLLAGAADPQNPERTLGGIPFRLGGLVMVGPGETSGGDGVRVPVKPEVDGIPINQKARRLHFLQGTHWHPRNGVLIGSYVVNYADGTRVSIPIRYGRDVVDWWTVDNGSSEAAQTRLAWVGNNAAAGGRPIRLFVKSWENPRPQVPIRSVDMVAGSQSPGPEAPAPFLVGLTVEKAGAEPPAAPGSPSAADTGLAAAPS
jgi:hypothetical protein